MSGILTNPYFMKSERLGFRCWSQDDLSLAREVWGDIEVTRFFGGPFSNEENGQRLEREITRMNTHRFQYWPMYLLSDNEHVGCCGLRPYRAEEEIHELGFHLRQSIGAEGWHRRLPAQSLFSRSRPLARKACPRVITLRTRLQRRCLRSLVFGMRTTNSLRRSEWIFPTTC